MFTSISVSGILSFGWEPVTLPMRPLNVLIGPNASGPLTRPHPSPCAVRSTAQCQHANAGDLDNAQRAVGL